MAADAGWRAALRYWRQMKAGDWRDLIAIAVLRRLPIDLSSAFGAKSGSIRGPRVYKGADKTARENLARLRPDIPAETREHMLGERWRCAGRTMAEFSICDRLLAKGRVELEGGENLLAAQAAGRGIILAALHLGNWEVFAIIHRLGVRISSFYQPRPTRGREHISQASRRRLGYRMLSPGPAGVRGALQTLAEGQPVVIFVDEEVDGVVRGPLFGRAAHRQSNLAYAAKLARRSGAAVFPAYILRTRGARFVVHIGPEASLPPLGETSLHDDIARVNAAVEPIVLAHLDQWFHLHERLEDPPAGDRL